MPNDKAQPAVAAPTPIKLAPVIDDGYFAELLDSNRFAQIQRVAKLFSESDLIPEVFQGKPANCAVALQMAFRMRVDPMMLMQSMYIVHGKPGIEAKLAIALINQRGPFSGPIQWKQEGEGDKRQWTAYATHRGTGEKCEATVTWKMAEAEGWTAKKKDQPSKWVTLPDLMGRYRSATFLGRLYCPEVLLGLPTDDELRDIGHERVIVGQRVDAQENAIKRFNASVDAPAQAMEALLREAVPLPTYAEIADAINRATNPDHVDDALSLSTAIEDQTMRNELADLANAKRKELNVEK